MWLTTNKLLSTKWKALFVCGMCFMVHLDIVKAQSFGAIDKVDAGRSGDSVAVYIRLNPEHLKQSETGVLTIIPRLLAGNDSVLLPAIHVMGRQPYYRYIRHDGMGIVDSTDIVMWDKRRYRPFTYVQKTAYQPWMDNAVLLVTLTKTEGCGDITDDSHIKRPLAHPQLVKAKPKIETRTGSVMGSVKVIFPLNRTEIHPELRNNRRELDSIRQTIDDVRSDSANVLDKMTIKGYASPEGPYDNNVRLARERTDSLADYVARNYGVDRRIISTDYEPEDWEGLKRFIREATDEQLEYRHALLAIAESQLPPDEKEKRIRTFYPKDFAYLLENCLPLLRHSDYRIDYTTKRRYEREGEVDTIWTLPKYRLSAEPVYTRNKPYDMLFALKTNLLFDLALAPNVEVEFPLGKKNRWSFMAEYWTPWYVWHHNSRAYELQLWGVELRKWLGECRDRRPKLTGTFLGYYLAIAKYDFEWSSVGDQGEFISGGITLGHSWTISRHWNLEASISAGALWGPRRHYHGEFDDTHLIWKYNKKLFYAGPTKAKISLVWMIGRKAKEGRR